MDQQPQFPTGNINPQSTPTGNAGLPPMQNSNFQQNPEGNVQERRSKRRMYTFVQIISVVFLLISFPLIVQGLLVVGPQFGKSVEATGTINEITTDLGGIIDQATGQTDLSNGCRIHYSFVTNDKTYDGSAHSSDLCTQPLGSEIEIAHSPTSPSNSTLFVEWAPYDTYLTVGSILLIVSLVVIIGSSILKRKVPKPEKNNTSYGQSY